MPKTSLSRRTFLLLGSTIAVGALTACHGGGGGGDGSSGSTAQVFRLSGRGRRVSRAAKAHNANKRFKTQQDADLNRAHAGDRSRIVRITVSKAEFNRLFANGPVADLRHV